MSDGLPAPFRCEATAYHALARSSLDAVIVTTVEGAILAANASACAMFRCPEAELIASGRSRFIDESDPQVVAALAEQLQTGHSSRELTYIRADGERFPAHTSSTLFRDEAGELRCVVVIRDCTGLVRQQAALEESEARFHGLVEHAPVGIYISQEGRFSYVNPTMARMFGYEVGELTGALIETICHPEDAPHVLDRWRRRLSGERIGPHSEFRGRRRDGTIINIELHAARITLRGQPAVFGHALDVTEQRVAERRLREQELRYRTLFELESDAILLTDLATHRIQDANDSAVGLYGYTRAELLSHHLTDLSVDEEPIRLPDEVASGTRRVLRIPQRHHRRKDGTTFIAEVTLRLLTLNDTSFALVAVRDVTETRRAENALRESQVLLKALADSTIDLIWSVDAAKFGLLTYNESLRRYFAFERHINLQPGMRPEDLFPAPEPIRQWRGFYERALREGSYMIEYEVFAHSRIVELNFSPLVRDGEVFGVSVFGRDITERKRAELKIAQYHSRLHHLAERLHSAREEESLRIARVVHDELGQHLTAIKMDLRAVESGLERLDHPSSGALLDKTVSATSLVDETVTIVQRIAAEMRPPILDKLGLFVALQHETEQFRQRAGVACRFLAPEPPPRLSHRLAITCYRIVQEALTNVARHAAATEVVVEFLVRPDAYVIEVRDNGRGMPPDVLNHTQSLGLLGMQERARPFRGEVLFERGPQGGTIVRAIFPIPEGAKANP